MKFNWNQSGMPVALVSRLGARNDFAAYKSVLKEAGTVPIRLIAESCASNIGLRQ